MNSKISKILTVLVVVVLLVCSAIIQRHLKTGVQIFMLSFGGLTLLTLSVKKPFSTSILFYILLGMLLYTGFFMLSQLIIDFLFPHDGWVIDPNGERQRVMSTKWIWAVISGLVISPIVITLYHKKINRSTNFEILISYAFIIVTAAVFIFDKVL